MKKKWMALCLGLLLAVQVCFSASATPHLNYVTDFAGLLTDQQISELQHGALELSERYDFGVYIVTMDDFTRRTSARDIESAAEEVYLHNELGEGSNQSGLLLLLSMEDRDWGLFAFGYGNTAFTDYGKDYLSKEFLDDFKHDDWFDGFEDYQELCDQMLSEARSGSPVDVDHTPAPPHARLYGIVACTVLGVLVAVLVAFLLKRQLKSVAHGTQAEAFVAGGGLKLTNQHDRYTHTTQSRVYDPPQKSSGSGGTTTRSSGGSSAGGKF